jgi:hypothetical protein
MFRRLRPLAVSGCSVEPSAQLSSAQLARIVAIAWTRVTHATSQSTRRQDTACMSPIAGGTVCYMGDRNVVIASMRLRCDRRSIASQPNQANRCHRPMFPTRARWSVRYDMPSSSCRPRSFRIIIVVLVFLTWPYSCTSTCLTGRPYMCFSSLPPTSALQWCRHP